MPTTRSQSANMTSQQLTTPAHCVYPELDTFLNEANAPPPSGGWTTIPLATRGAGDAVFDTSLKTTDPARPIKNLSDLLGTD